MVADRCIGHNISKGEEREMATKHDQLFQ